MENKLKLRISRMFRSSFGSCKSRNISDIIEKPVFVCQDHQNLDVIETAAFSSPKPPPLPPLPSLCKPRCPKTTEELIHNSCIIPKNTCTRQKVSERYSLFYSADNKDGHNCPPVSPLISTKDKKKKKKKKKRRSVIKRNKDTINGGIVGNLGLKGGFWFSSDEEEEREDETDTLFSSKTLSSSDYSSGSRRRRTDSRRKVNGTSRRRGGSRDSVMGLLPLQVNGKVMDSFAVVKQSSDPYNDFRVSMVEIILERQIFSAKDLEQLLQCFLRLNSGQHHKVIVEVFMEIWDALFS